MTFAELLTRIPDPHALEERAAIIQFDSGGPPEDREGAEVEAVRQWVEANRPKKQAKMFR
jgi:hypothetical protein